jgi:hypothetical protein
VSAPRPLDTVAAPLVRPPVPGVAPADEATGPRTRAGRIALGACIGAIYVGCVVVGLLVLAAMLGTH